MSGDLGSGPDGARDRRGDRPQFLPPTEGYPPPEPEAPYEEPYAGEQAPEAAPPGWVTVTWHVLSLAAAMALLVSAFLPWVRAQVVVSAFGGSLSEDAGSAPGIDADGTVLVVPVLALVAAAMMFWAIAARDPRIGTLIAVPGALALLVCGIFALRLDSAREELTGTGPLMGYTVTVGYGWYVAAATSLLVVGFGLVRPLVARVSRRNRDGAAAWDHAASP